MERDVTAIAILPAVHVPGATAGEQKGAGRVRRPEPLDGDVLELRRGKPSPPCRQGGGDAVCTRQDRSHSHRWNERTDRNRRAVTPPGGKIALYPEGSRKNILGIFRSSPGELIL